MTRAQIATQLLNEMAPKGENLLTLIIEKLNF